MKKLLLWSSLFWGLTLQLSAQPGSVSQALNQFLSTSFFREYDQLRSKAEESVRDFKRIEANYSEEQKQAVSNSYNAAAQYFNTILVNVKKDLLDPNKRKLISKYPNEYAKQLETDLQKARDFYANTYQKEIAEVTQGQITGSGFIALLMQVLNYTKEAINVLNQFKSEIKKFNAELLDARLLTPYSFKTWENIT
jgi:hypothetical protein